MTLLALTLGLCMDGHAQEWVLQNSGVTNILRDVFFITPAQGWVVGDQGLILATTDGGDTWTAQVSNTNFTLTSVFFTSPTKGWIGGSSGLIYTTENGGATWTTVTTAPFTDHEDIWFTSPDTGYIVGGLGIDGVIKSTTDGGQTWSSTAVENQLESVHFLSGTQGWACGSRGVIYRTTNGVDWTQLVPPGPDQLSNLNTIFMLNASEGWACGSPTFIRHTVDGGITWTNQPSGTNAGKTGLYYSDPQNGWTTTTSSIIGGNPIRSTTDGGATWEEDDLVLPTLYNLRFYSPSLAWAVGDFGVIVRYGTGGSTAVAETEANGPGVRISPNPVTDRLFLSGAAPSGTVDVYDAAGALVLRAHAATAGIDVSALPTGSYTLQCRTLEGDAIVVERFVKE